LSIFSLATAVVVTTVGPSSLTIPAGVTSITAKLWGAGGASSSASGSTPYAGGSGAFVACNISVTSGATIYLIVGQGGRAGVYSSTSGNALGGGGMLCHCDMSL